VSLTPPCEVEEFCGRPPHLSLSDRSKEPTAASAHGLHGSRLSLQDFIAELPGTIRKTHNKDGNGILSSNDLSFDRGTDHDPISALYKRLDLKREDWERFAILEPSKNYTRNLVSTDNETFTLILMCWNSGKESPIHDHPCDGCWMRVCEGNVQEKRYVREETTDTLECISDELFVENQLAYITNSMGLHKVGNPSSSTRAVTLHLYSPPFKSCKIWLNPSKASKPSECCMQFHSEYGATV